MAQSILSLCCELRTVNSVLVVLRVNLLAVRLFLTFVRSTFLKNMIWLLACQSSAIHLTSLLCLGKKSKTPSKNTCSTFSSKVKVKTVSKCNLCHMLSFEVDQRFIDATLSQN